MWLKRFKLKCLCLSTLIIFCFIFSIVAFLITISAFADPKTHSYSTESTRFPLVVAIHSGRLTIVVADPKYLPFERFQLHHEDYLSAVGKGRLTGGSFSIHTIDAPVWSKTLGIYIGRSFWFSGKNPTYRLQFPAWVFWAVTTLLAYFGHRMLRVKLTHAATACPTCNYDLRGSVESAVCPECGTAITPARRERLRAAALTTEAGVTTEAGGGRLDVDEHDDTR